jgi:hypothetical protein
VNVLIVDNKFNNYKYVNTLVPSTPVALISGFHKAHKHNVELFLPNKEYKLEGFDKIYLVNDSVHTLPVDTVWMSLPQTVVCGRYYKNHPRHVHDSSWELFPPDFTIYHSFIDYWRHRFPSYNLSRLEIFFEEPFKMKRGKSIFYPDTPGTVIIDDDIHEWDENFTHLSTITAKNIRFNNPLRIDKNMKAALELFALRTIMRKHFWAEFYLDENITDAEIYEMARICGEMEPGRMFRVKMWASGENDEAWQSLILRASKAMEHFRMLATKRIYFEPYNYKQGQTNFPYVIQFMKRWAAKGPGYKNNSVVDYMIYDGLQTIDKIADFLHTPEKVAERNPKARALLNFITNYPNLAYALSQSFPKGAW